MEKVTRAVRMGGTIEELAAGDVEVLIGRGRYEAIKRTDAHPMFLSLKVGYEGVSKGALTIDGQTRFVPKRWYRDVVEQLGDRLNIGPPGLFAGNHTDRGNPNRPRVGEVLTGYSGDGAGGQRIAYGVAYVSDPDARERVTKGELKACSVEGDVIVAGLDGQEPFVEEVRTISGVCLADPAKETPGFAEAGVDAVIAELQSGGIDEMADKKPSEMYTRNELAEDPIVQNLIQAGRGNTYQDLQKEKDRADQLQKDLDAEKTKTADLTKQLKDAGSAANTGRIAQILSKKVQALKFTAEEKALIQKRLDGRVTSEDSAAKEADLEKLVEEALVPEVEHTNAMRKLYGKEAVAGDSGKSEDDTDGTGDKAEGDGDDADDPFLNANPLEAEKAA